MAVKGLWYLGSEKYRGVERPTIRRPVVKGGKQSQERYPARKYRHLLDDAPALQELVVRLNQPTLAQRAKQAVEIKHAFISERLLDEYRDELLAQIPSQERAACEYFYLRTYFLHFFIGQQNLPNPVDWHRVHKTVWATFLKSEEAPRAASTKKEIVQAANKFMLWLHNRRPDEVPPLKFQPLSRAAYKVIDAQRAVDGHLRQRRAITDADWKRILRALSNSPIRAPASVAYFYGLRRSECLGLSAKDVRRDFLAVEKSLERMGRYLPLKGREARKVPHWFATPDQAYRWVAEIQETLSHPDTLTDRWNKLMEKLDMGYDFHDLRHTFITRAIRAHTPVDVMHAAGHKNIETTMRYLHDDRDLGDAPYKPAA